MRPRWAVVEGVSIGLSAGGGGGGMGGGGIPATLQHDGQGHAVLPAFTLWYNATVWLMSAGPLGMRNGDGRDDVMVATLHDIGGHNYEIRTACRARDRQHDGHFGVAKGSKYFWFDRYRGFVGSVNYASPEQIEGSALTPASDIYALTAVLYQSTAACRMCARVTWRSCVHTVDSRLCFSITAGMSLELSTGQFIRELCSPRIDMRARKICLMQFVVSLA